MEHRIEFVSRDKTGITAVVTQNGVIDVCVAVADIRSGRAHFVTGPTAWDRAHVTIRHAFGGPYLYANWDGTRRNNLHDLGTPPAWPAGQHQTLLVRAGLRILSWISFGYTNPAPESRQH